MAKERKKPGRKQLRAQLKREEDAENTANKGTEETRRMAQKKMKGRRKQRQEEEEADATTKGKATKRQTFGEHGFPVLYIEGRGQPPQKEQWA